jgi:Spx/MgsR family transcriptional regulator
MPALSQHYDGRMSIVLYGIPNCDTVKKARAWLNQRGVSHEFHDFKKLGVPEARLDCWIAALGWEKLINRQGTTWRKLDPAVQAGVKDAASAKSLMRAQASVIKRPVVEWGPTTTIGFDGDAWALLQSR